MRAVVYQRYRGRPAVRAVPDPACPPAGVVIKVAATGLCRSDWHGWMGHDPGIALPHVPGHEFAGTVAAVGSDVRSWRVGDRVTVPFVCACGRCTPCREGNQQVCDDQFQPGFTSWGSFAELVAVDRAEVNLIRLPDALDFVAAAALGCRFGTAYRAVMVHGAIRAGQWMVVYGCGGVGLSAVMIAAVHGARVVAVDVVPAALEFAQSVGAEAVIDGRTTDVAPAVRELTGGGAHVSIDALGSTDTCTASIRSLRKRGRHVQVGLMLADDAFPAIPVAEILARELEFVGSHGMPAHAYPGMLAEVTSGVLRPQALVAKQIPLEGAAKALTTMGTSPPLGLTVIMPQD